MGIHNQAVDYVQREFCSSQESHILIGKGFTDIFHQGTVFDEKRFFIPPELGNGSSRRIPFGNSIEICLHDMCLHHSMQMSGKTQGNTYILMFCLGENVVWHEANNDKTIELKKGSGVLYRAEDINEIGSYDKNKHYQGVTIYLSPQIFDKYFREAAQRV